MPVRATAAAGGRPRRTSPPRASARFFVRSATSATCSMSAAFVRGPSVTGSAVARGRCGSQGAGSCRPASPRSAESWQRHDGERGVHREERRYGQGQSVRPNRRRPDPSGSRRRTSTPVAGAARPRPARRAGSRPPSSPSRRRRAMNSTGIGPLVSEARQPGKRSVSGPVRRCAGVACRLRRAEPFRFPKPSGGARRFGRRREVRRGCASHRRHSRGGGGRRRSRRACGRFRRGPLRFGGRRRCRCGIRRRPVRPRSRWRRGGTQLPATRHRLVCQAWRGRRSRRRRRAADRLYRLMHALPQPIRQIDHRIGIAFLEGDLPDAGAHPDDGQPRSGRLPLRPQADPSPERVVCGEETRREPFVHHDRLRPLAAVLRRQRAPSSQGNAEGLEVPCAHAQHRHGEGRRAVGPRVLTGRVTLVARKYPRRCSFCSSPAPTSCQNGTAHHSDTAERP